MSNKSTVLLEHHLKEFKLPTFLKEYDKVASRCAADGVDHPDYLLRLSELELIDRNHRMVDRRIKAARFPTVKSLDTFDFLAIPSLNKALVLELARCEYIDRKDNVIALGLGLAAFQRGLSVGFTTAAALVHELTEARYEQRLLNLQRKLASLKLLIIDELGFVPLSKTGPSCSSRSSASAMNEARSWLPLTYHSTSGPRSLALNTSPGPSSTASPTMSISWRRTGIASASSRAGKPTSISHLAPDSCWLDGMRLGFN